jgi:hypothetical protein
MMNCVGGESLGGDICCCTSFEHRCGCAKGAETELDKVSHVHDNIT